MGSSGKGGATFKFHPADPINRLARRVPLRAGSLLVWCGATLPVHRPPGLVRLPQHGRFTGCLTGRFSGRDQRCVHGAAANRSAAPRCAQFIKAARRPAAHAPADPRLACRATGDPIAYSCN